MSDEPRSKSNTEIHFSNACERPIVSKQNDKTYTQDDIGSQVTLNIDGVALNDVVVGGGAARTRQHHRTNVRVCHIFARLTMMEAMMAASAHASKERDDWSDEMA